jgi:hypothetical protein
MWRRIHQNSMCCSCPISLSRFENRARHSQVLDRDSRVVENGDIGIGNTTVIESTMITAIAASDSAV